MFIETEPNIAKDIAKAFGCDEISPEGKAGQERGSPAVGHPKGGSAKTRGSERTPLLRQPPAPLARFISSSPKLSKVSAATKLTCPWPSISSGRAEEMFQRDKRDQNKVQTDVPLASHSSVSLGEPSREGACLPS